MQAQPRNCSRDAQGHAQVEYLAVTWDATPGILDAKNGEKAQKYKGLTPLFAPRLVLVVGLSFCAVSMVSSTSNRNGKLLGLNEADLAWLASPTLIGSPIILQRFGKLVR